MEKYIGVKLIEAVEAEPCSQDQFAGAKNFGDLSKLSGGIDREGYKVVYEDGYTSWSPKDIFEKAYKREIDILELIPEVKESSPEHQKRVFGEAVELRSKLISLTKFLQSEAFQTISDEEQNRLYQQCLTMKHYLTILVERINNF